MVSVREGLQQDLRSLTAASIEPFGFVGSSGASMSSDVSARPDIPTYIRRPSSPDGVDTGGDFRHRLVGPVRKALTRASF